MDATLSRLSAIRARKQSNASINDWLGLDDYYRSRRYFVRKAAEALTSARILRDCAEHRGEPAGPMTAASLERAAQYRRQAMEMTDA